MFGEGDCNGGHCVEVCDAEFLNVLEQQKEVKLGHDVDRDFTMESTSHEECLTVGMVQRQEAEPTGPETSLFVVGIKGGHVGNLESVGDVVFVGDFDTFWDASCATGVVESEGGVTLAGARVIIPLKGTSIGFGGEEITPVLDALYALSVAIIDLGVVDKDPLLWIKPCQFSGLDAGVDGGVRAEEICGAAVSQLMSQLSGDKSWIGTGEDTTGSEGPHEDNRDKEIIATEEQDAITLFEVF